MSVEPVDLDIPGLGPNTIFVDLSPLEVQARKPVVEEALEEARRHNADSFGQMLAALVALAGRVQELENRNRQLQEEVEAQVAQMTLRLERAMASLEGNR